MVSAADGDPAHRRRPVGGAAPGPGRVAALAHEVDGFVRAAVADKRRSPGDDLISLLVRARDQDGLISEDELHGQVMMMLVAGQDPSINSVGNSLHALLAHPGQLAALRDDPTLIGTGMNELLHYESPLPFTSWRGTLEPVEFGEVTVPAEDSLFLCLGAANRDPARSPEPDRLDLHRTGPGHLAFGHGAHYCLGAHVGRMTAEAAVTTVLRRLPGLRPAGPPRWRPSMFERGSASCPSPGTSRGGGPPGEPLGDPGRTEGDARRVRRCRSRAGRQADRVHRGPGPRLARPDADDRGRRERFGVRIPDEVAWELHTVGSVVSYVEERDIGEIWVRGDSVADGYLGDPRTTAEHFAATTADGEGPFLRTGDLGLLQDGELFVTGRAKDLIIANGRNIHPQDIERVSESTDPATGLCAAFPLPDASGHEHIVLVQEVRPLHLDGRTPASLADLVRRLLAHELRLAVQVVVVGPMSVPRTTSGKIQRSRTGDELRAGRLSPLHRDLASGHQTLTRRRLAAAAGPRRFVGRRPGRPPSAGPRRRSGRRPRCDVPSSPSAPARRGGRGAVAASGPSRH